MLGVVFFTSARVLGIANHDDGYDCNGQCNDPPEPPSHVVQYRWLWLGLLPRGGCATPGEICDDVEHCVVLQSAVMRLVLTIVLLISLCTSAGAQTADSQTVILGVCDVMRNLESYSGKTFTVRGEVYFSR